MKRTISQLIKSFTLILATIASFSSIWCQAQTSSPTISGGLQEIGQAIASSANWTAIGGIGQSLKGNRHIAFADVAYNFNSNVGIVAGVDELWATGQKQVDIVKGGVTLSATIHPFAFVGSTFLTNAVATPFVADLLATPKGPGGIGNIITEGVNFDLASFKNFELVAGAQYETRTGQGFWNGNYGLFHLGISRRF